MNTIQATIRLTAPLYHGAFGGDAGNAAMLRRMTLVSIPGMPRIPVISGNAIRGTIRRHLMRELFVVSGVTRTTFSGRDREWDRLYGALVNGGHLDGSEARRDPAEYRELRESIPVLSVLGAALYSYMLPGHCRVGIAWLRCQETIAAGFSHGEAPPAEAQVEEISQTRHVEREHQDPKVSGVTPMPVTIETVMTGAEFDAVINFAPHTPDVERGAIAHGLSLITTLGAKGGSGLGTVTLTHDGDEEPYVIWLREHTTDLSNHLQRLAATLV